MQDSLLKFCKMYPFFYWIEETQAMRMVDGMLNENIDIIFSIIVDLVSRDIISSSIRFD